MLRSFSRKNLSREEKQAITDLHREEKRTIANLNIIVQSMKGEVKESDLITTKLLEEINTITNETHVVREYLTNVASLCQSQINTLKAPQRKMHQDAFNNLKTYVQDVVPTLAIEEDEELTEKNTLVSISPTLTRNKQVAKLVSQVNTLQEKIIARNKYEQLVNELRANVDCIKTNISHFTKLLNMVNRDKKLSVEKPYSLQYENKVSISLFHIPKDELEAKRVTFPRLPARHRHRDAYSRPLTMKLIEPQNSDLLIQSNSPKR